MIDIKMTGTFPVIEENPIPQAMQEIADLMRESILQNFLSGGRPQWPYRKVGAFQTPVISNLGGLSGRIASKVESRFTADTAEAGIFDADSIDWIHQTGGTIDHKAIEGRLQVFTINGVTIFTYRTRRHDIKIPARPFVMFQSEDTEKILSTLSNVIMRNVKNEPIN